MRIEITGARISPRWEDLQNVLRSALDDETGLLTRISRDDKGCNYRLHGSYTCEFQGDRGSETVYLTVK